MCVILIGEITREQHKLAKEQNPDGFSLFTEKQGLIKQPKEWDVIKAIGEWGIWHYRIGTSGSKIDLNVHPFKICGDKYLLYHNGVLGEGKGILSDTHALAKTLKNVSLSSAQSIIAALANTSGKFVIVSVRDPHELYIYGKWECDGGVLMSHKLYTYVPAGKAKTGFVYGGKSYGIHD